MSRTGKSNKGISLTCHLGFPLVHSGYGLHFSYGLSGYLTLAKTTHVKSDAATVNIVTERDANV